MLPIHFASPQWLLLLVLLPVIWHIGRGSLAGLPAGRYRVALWLRLLLVFLLILALAKPQWQRAADVLSVTFVVDQSASIPVGKQKEITEGIQAVLRSKPLADKVGLIYFGADASCEYSPSSLPFSPERQSVIDPKGSDLARALRLAVATFPAATRKRVILVTDGNENRGDVLSEAERLRAQGIQLDLIPISYAHEREILVRKAILPEEVRAGVPFSMRVQVQSAHQTEALLEVRRGGNVQAQMRVPLVQGSKMFSLPLVIADKDDLSGTLQYEVSVLPLDAGDDQMVQNNSAVAFTRVAGPPTVLYIDGNLGQDKGYQPYLQETLLTGLRLVEAGKGESDLKPTLRVCDVNDIPGPQALSGYDCIILDNVAAEYLGAERMEEMRSLVNGQGVGLVMIGGDRSFGMGNYRMTPVEEALPVEMDLKHKKVIQNGALVLAVDRSGSMEGEKLAQAIAAATAALQVLSDADYIGVLAFDAQAEWLVEPVLARRRYVIQKQIEQLASAGGTDIMVALREAHARLSKVPAAYRHILVLSDGQSPDDGMPSLMERIVRDKITVSCVGIGEPSGQKLMEEIARRGGGRYYFVRDPRKLPRIFIHESLQVRRGLLVEEPFVPDILQAHDEFLADIHGASLPSLHGYVATTARPGASVSLASTNENKDPVLAHWRFGLGRSVAFCSDAKNRWSKEWLGWEGYAPFWSGMVQRILRQRPAALRMHTVVEGDAGRVVVDALDEDGLPLGLLHLTAVVTQPGHGILTVPMRQVGVCRYEGTFPASESGQYSVAVRSAIDLGDPPCAAYGGVVRSVQVESQALQTNVPFLHRLADAGNGKMLAWEDMQRAAFRREGLPPSISVRDCWALILLLVAVLLPFDVFVRRVMIDVADVRAWWRKRRSAEHPGEPLSVEINRPAGEEKTWPSVSEPTLSAHVPQSSDSGEGKEVSSASEKPSEEEGKEPPAAASVYTSRLLRAKEKTRKKRG